MKKRALELRMLASFLTAVAFGFPLQVMIQYGHLPNEPLAILSKLTPLNFAIMVLALITAAAAYEASRWIVVLAPLLFGALAWNGWLFLVVDANFNGLTAIFGSAGVALAHGVMLRKAPLNLLLNPKLRWWRTATRAKVKMKTSIHPVTGGDISARAFDVSVSGAFFPIDHMKWLTPSGTTVPNQIVPGVRCALRIDLDRYQTIYCSGQIVRKAEAKGEYPAGFAVQFIGMGTGDRRKLAQFLSSFTPQNVQAVA